MRQNCSKHSRQVELGQAELPGVRPGQSGSLGLGRGTKRSFVANDACADVKLLRLNPVEPFARVPQPCKASHLLKRPRDLTQLDRSTKLRRMLTADARAVPGYTGQAEHAANNAPSLCGLLSMQEQLGHRKLGNRPTGAGPLAHLQHNVLPAHVRTLQNSVRLKLPGCAAPNLSCAPLEPIQKLLQALGLLQYSAVFAKEEIDPEALQCLSAQDLQAIGVRDPTHRRKLLSAAVQLRSGTLSKKPNAGASSEAQPAQHACTQMPVEAVPSVCSNAATLDKQALPASARASKATVQTVSSEASIGNSSSSGRSNTLHHAAPDKTSSAGSVLALPANKSRKIRQLQTAGQAANLAGTDAVRGHLLVPSSDSAIRSEATLTSMPVLHAVNTAVSVVGTAAKGSSKQRQPAMPAIPAAPIDLVAGSAAPSGMHAPATSAAACVEAKDSVVAPQSRADEEHQLALALSASMGEPLEGGSILPLRVRSTKAAMAEGIFNTMMTASRQHARQQSASQPSTSTATAADPPQTFSRRSEQALLDIVFSDVLCTSASAPAQLQSYGLDRAAICCSDAVAVETEASLWKWASHDEPPHCTLEERVQKRKAAQYIAQEQARKEAIVQQCVAAEAMLRSCESAEPKQAVGQVSNQHLGSQSGAESEHQNSCINLALSPSKDGQKGAHTLQGCTVACTVALDRLQSVKDPMKRIRLLALQQELKAARQTVSDLERMILEVHNST